LDVLLNGGDCYALAVTITTERTKMVKGGHGWLCCGKQLAVSLQDV